MGANGGFLVGDRSLSQAVATAAGTKPATSPPPPGMPPFVEAVYRELARCLSGPNSLAILAATATTVGLRRDRIGPRHLPDLLAHVQASFGFFGVPEDRRNECLTRLREIAAPPIAPRAPGPVAIPIEHEADIVRARLAGKLLCRELRFSDGCTAKVVAAISEVARNIFKHAKKGSVTVRATPGDPAGLEIVARDNGPGIADVDALLTATNRCNAPGAGLRGARDLVDAFAVVSRLGLGTTVTLRKVRSW